MIVPENKTHGPTSDVKETLVVEDAPPEYAPSEPTSASSSRLSSLIQPPEDVKPTNFLLISRDHSPIKGKWVIDPSLVVPKTVLPPLEVGETRANAKLESTSASIHGSIWVVSSTSNSDALAGPATLRLHSTYGSTRMKIFRMDERQPVAITISSNTGHIHLAIPRTFRGPVIFTTSFGSVRLSDDMEGQLTNFSEARGVRRGFIGNHADWVKDTDGWTGDSLELETQYGSIRLAFSNENDNGCGDMETMIGGFFSKLFKGK